MKCSKEVQNGAAVLVRAAWLRECFTVSHRIGIADGGDVRRSGRWLAAMQSVFRHCCVAGSVAKSVGSGNAVPSAVTLSVWACQEG